MRLDLEQAPRNKSSHHLADWSELLCLTSLDGELSGEDLVDRRTERIDVGEGEDDERLDSGVTIPTDPSGPEATGTAAKKVDRLRLEAEDVFSQLAYRAGTFKSSYPFRVNKDDQLLSRKRAITAPQKRYIFLLLASSLGLVDKRSRSILAQRFEQLGTEVIAGWLPNHAEVHGFGTAAGRGRYRGTAWTKAQKLASDLKEKLAVAAADFDPHNTGDVGLDTVAWLVTGDNTSGRLVFFAQSTCKTDWEGKQNESGQRWRNHMPPKAPRGNLLCIPFCFRKSDGSWFDEKWPYDCVLLDRVRLDWLCRTHLIVSNAVPVELVESAIEFRMGVV